VRDAAHLLDAVAGPGVGDKYPAPPPARPYAAELGAELGTGPGRLRVAVTAKAWSGVAVDASVATAAFDAARALERMGHRVEEAGPAIDWEAVVHSLYGELVANAAPVLTAPRRPDPARLEAVSRRVLADVEAMSALDLVAALDAQNRVTRAVGRFFTAYDLLVTPTLGQPPAPHGTLRYDDPEHTVRSWLDAILAYGPFTTVFNISGQPAISLPLGETPDGLPVGVQFVAAYGREDVLFRVAAGLEAAMPWRDRVPAVFVGR
jgi:amidase